MVQIHINYIISNLLVTTLALNYFIIRVAE